MIPLDRRQTGAGFRLAQPGPAVVHADVGAFADAAEVALADHRGAAVGQAHVHVVGGVVGLHAILDRVAGDRACNRAGDGGGVLAALAVGAVVGDLARRGGADDAAEHGAGGVGHAAAAGGDHLDAGHGAAVVAGAAGRRRAVAVTVAVARRGGGAAGGRERGEQGG